MRSYRRLAFLLAWIAGAIASSEAHAAEVPQVPEIPKIPEIRFQREAPQAQGAPAPAPDDPKAFEADFRHSPPWWQTAICLPDDWQKTLVSKEGALLYDYPGEFSGFGTRVSVSVAGAEGATVDQRLEAPRTPIVETTLSRDGAMLARWKCLAVVPGPDQNLPGYEPGEAARVIVEPTTGATPLPGWGSPGVPSIDAFRNIVAGFGVHIGYRFRAPARGRYSVALGFMESHHADPGRRIVEVFIEGKKAKRVDLIGDLGRHKPGVFVFDARDESADGYVSIDVRPAPESQDQNAILNVLWIFRQGMAPDPQALITGNHKARPLAMVDCGGAGPARKAPAGPPRGDLMLIEARSGGGAIQVAVDSKDPLFTEENDRGVYLAGVRFLTTSAAPKSARHAEKNRFVLTFPDEVRELAVYCASGHDAGDVDLSWAKSQPGRAAAYWAGADFPYGKITVPDPAIQSLLDASIRNIYQARELRDGLPVFQVGPTCYRGLWIVDGTFILEAMTYLGRVDEVRAGIEHLLRQAKPDGSFEIIPNYWKENGIVLYLLYRHAALTQDWAWLFERWYVVQNLVDAIRRLRIRSRASPDAPEAGLIPTGFPDGGIGGCVPEYTNVYWSLAGLNAAVKAGKMLGRDTLETTAIEAEYQSLLSAFRDAAKRDSKKGPDGKPYLPILMKEDPQVDPVRGQWAFCHAIHPGEVFALDDPLVRGNMALLDAKSSEGLVLGTGWMADGIWNYFASFYGHAHLWLGGGEKAAKILYAFANHASPLLVWREEQHPSGGGSGLVGDMPHNWASAEFIRLTRNLLVLERGSELHLLEGVPRKWLRPGALTALEGIYTNFGPVGLRLEVDSDGKSAALRVDYPKARPPSRIVVHLGPWWRAGESPSLSGDRSLFEARIPLAP